MRLTRNVVKQVPIATVRRLLPLYERMTAVIAPAEAESTESVEYRIEGNVIADRTVYGI